MLEDPIVKDQFLIGSDTVFDFGHRIFSPSDITCYVYDPATEKETELTSGTDFSVGLKPETTDYSNGARVTLLAEQPAAGKLTVVRTVLPEQGVALPNFGKIPSESLEAQLDRTIAAVQQIHDTVQLAYKIPYGQSGTITPEQAIKRMISSGGGGGGGGSSYDFSNEFNVTFGGSVSINKIDKSKITGLQDALDEKQDKLTSGASYHINVDSAGHADVAGAFVYDGPFAVNIGKVENTYYAGMNAGYVVVGGSRHLINGISTEDGIPFSPDPDFDTVFLTLSSGGGVISSGLTMRSDGQAADTVIVRLASAATDSSVNQIQFGDITTVPWGLSGGGGGGGIMIPNYAKLMGEAYCIVSSGGVAISSTTNLGSGSAYYATANGYLRISLKNASSGASQDCLRVAIGGADTWIALYDLQSSTDGGCIRGGTQILPISSGSYFRVYSLSNNSVGDVLVKFDHAVSLTAV